MSDDFSDRPEGPADAAGEETRAASWIISGMAEDVVIDAEREALRRGLTLGAWLEEVIQHALLSESTRKDQAPDSTTGDDGFSLGGD